MQQIQTVTRKFIARSLLLLALGLAVTPAFAQSENSQSEDIAIAAQALPPEVGQLLHAGGELERQHRWGDALAHYDDAVRKHPEDRQLNERFNIARLHYSVERRYSDHSFLDSVQALTAQQAADLYGELLLKLETHYVANPPWQSLAQRGTASVDVALTKTAFLRQNGIHADAKRLAQVRRELYRPLENRVIHSRADAAAVAQEVAQVAVRQVGLSPTATALEFTAAAAGGLDHYSAFLSGDQLKEIYAQIEGNFVGLGVELKAASGGLEIVHVIPASPAERAGIQSGDVIAEIDGKNIASLSTDEAATLLTGEEGSYVQVRVVPPHKVAKPEAGVVSAATRAPWVAKVRREHVEVPSLEDVDIVDATYGVAYLRVPVFQKTTSRDLEKSLWDLHEKGMRSLVLDLRGNPGGLLTSAVELADKFVADGRIVSTRGRSAGEDFDYRAHRAGTWRVPLVVLIDDQSASASEIFAAAIRDNRRGTVVGEKSFGKGSVQGIFPLGYGGAGVRLTTAKFYSPNGQPISNRGVQPDIVVRHAAGPPEGLQVAGFRGTSGGDDALAKAIEAARGQVALR